MNEQNLKPVRTVSEAREKGRKGGIASGKARQTAKTIKAALVAELEKTKGEGADVQSAAEAIAKAMVRESIKGNVAAAKFIAEINGEMVQKVEFTQPPTFVVADFGDDE